MEGPETRQMGREKCPRTIHILARGNDIISLKLKDYKDNLIRRKKFFKFKLWW